MRESGQAGVVMNINIVCVLCITIHLTLGASPLALAITLNDGRPVPGIALGTWLGNNTKGRVSPVSDEVEQAVLWALDAGYRHIDTASAYRIEDQVGRALQRKLHAGMTRDEVFVTTKLSNDRHARAAVVPSLRESLEKLQLDYVDLYLIHWPLGQYRNQTFDNTDYLETWRGMMDAKSLGLTKSIALSNFNQLMMDRILENGLERPAVLQVEINLNLQQPSLLSYCKAKNITVMGYTPFGSLFPKKATSEAPPPRIDTPAMLNIAQKQGKTVPQIVLAYLISLGVIPIPKSLTKSRIEENFNVFDVKLSSKDKELLRKYDKTYRTLPQEKWIQHQYYPFEKPEKFI